nr:reverse transcriptase domain-containing protein [Tanacetum cinerariifolium]
MRTRSSSNLPVVSPNPSTSNPKHRYRRHSKQPFILEESPVDTMADQRTMAELLRAPTEGYKDLLRACPHYGFTELHQLDTFCNALNPADQDSLNSTAGGNLLEIHTQDVLTIIKNKSKVRNSRKESVVSQVKSCNANSNSSLEIAKLTHAVNQQTNDVTTAMIAILKQFQATPPPASVKVVEEICVTCGGAHPYYQCLAGGGNTFPELQDNIQGYVAAAAVNYNLGNSVYRPLEKDERVEETLTDQDLCTDIAKITKKGSKPDKNEHEIVKSAQKPDPKTFLCIKENQKTKSLAKANFNSKDLSCQLHERSNEDIRLKMAKLIKNNRILLNNNIFPHEEASMEVLLAKERILKLIQAWDKKQIELWSFPELLHQLLNDSQTINEMLKQRKQAANLAVQKEQEEQAVRSFTPYWSFSMIDDEEVLLVAWERFSEIKQAFTDKRYQPEEIQELMCKLLEDMRNINEELSEYINSPSWNHHTFYNDDEEHSIQYKEYLENSSNAITPVLPTEEPKYSLSMGYEHPSTIPETESNEVIKSSVKNLVQIPREYEDIEYVEASLFDSEFVSLEEENDVYQEEKEFDLEDILQIQDVILHEKLLSINRLIADIEFLNDNSTPDHFSNHTEETRSGSTTAHVNNSPPEYDSFCFEIEHDQGRITSIVKNDISDNSTNDPLLEVVNLFLVSVNSIPPGIENIDYDSEGDIYFLEELLVNDSIPLPENESSNFDHHDDPSFPRPLSEPPDVEFFFNFEPNSGELILVVMNNIDELNKDESFDPEGGVKTPFLNLASPLRASGISLGLSSRSYLKKLGDPGKFLIPCGFNELKCKALADLGASINLMPLSVWKKLGLPELISTRMTLELANRAICPPAGIARDVFVSIGKFTFPADFVIVDYESDHRVLLILGRPFLRIARALIDVHGEEMILCDGDEKLSLNMILDNSSYSNQPQKESINLINVFNNSNEDFLEDLFSTNQPSGNPTFSSHPELTSSKVKDDIFDPEGGNVLPEKLLDLDYTKDLHPPLHVNPLSGSTTYSSYSILKDKIDQNNLADLNDNLIEHALDYSSPPLFNEYDDDLFEVKSDTKNFYDDPFDSKGEKIKESKLLIDELNLPCDFLLPFEYDSFITEDFSRVNALPSTNNEDKYSRNSKTHAKDFVLQSSFPQLHLGI